MLTRWDLTSQNSLQYIVLICTAGLALLIGSGIVLLTPLLLVLPIVSLALPMLAASPLARCIFFTAGGLIVLQTSDGISVMKAAYFVGSLALGLIGLRTFIAHGAKVRVGHQRSLVLLTIGWILLVLGSFFVARYNGADFTFWLRDATSYLFLGIAPLFSLDLSLYYAYSENNRRRANIAFVLLSLLATVSFSVTWLARRGYAEIGEGQFLLSSFALGGAAFCYSCAMALTVSRRAGLWIFISVATLMLFLITGTRTTLLLLLAPLVMTLSSRRLLDLRTVRRAFFSLFATACLALIAFASLGGSGSFAAEQVIVRFSNLGGVQGSSAEGQSYSERITQTTMTTEAFMSSPIWGVGPGHQYVWKTPQGKVKSALVLDSPTSIPAKFGMLGVMLTAATIVLMIAIARSARKEGLGHEGLALLGFAALTSALCLLASPVDDKGFSLGFAFLVGMALGRLVLQRNIQEGVSNA